MTPITSCLVPSRFDIVIDGRRYGYVFKESYFNWKMRGECVRWKARMDIPERIDSRPVFGDGCFAANSLDDAVLLAFENFARSGELTDSEYARLAMRIFEGTSVH